MAHQGHGIGAKAAAIFGEYYQREKDPAAYEPIYPGRGSVWSDKEQLWIPEILNNRKEEHPNRAAVSGAGVQPQKEVDEAAKKKAGNPLSQGYFCREVSLGPFYLQEKQITMILSDDERRVAY